jgi:hypothetical protein
MLIKILNNLRTRILSLLKRDRQQKSCVECKENYCLALQQYEEDDMCCLCAVIYEDELCNHCHIDRMSTMIDEAKDAYKDYKMGVDKQ